MTNRRPRVFPLLLALLCASAPAKARAAAQSDPRAAARRHFDNGVAAFNDRRFAEAADEFDAAYQASPAFAVLYNIGQVNVALGRSVEAVDAFEKYLRQGASAVAAERRREVETEIEKQLGRIGAVTVRTVPENAEVRVDGKLVGATPLVGPVRMTAGKHTVEAMLLGRAPRIREIDVPGRSRTELELRLEAVSGPAGPAAVSPVAVSSVTAAPVPASARGPKAALDGPEPVAGSGSRPQPFPAASIGWQRPAGYLVALGGLVTMTTGGLLAFSGANQASDAGNTLAHAGTLDVYQKARPDYDEGKSRNQRGWTIAGIGAAMVVGGVLLVATAPEKTSGRPGLAPWVATGSGGLAIGGVF
jgi:tetratricopeptide (TPR) repeat protein